jgi:DhnA family fructose-bisphosphate aldolase class Ia
MESRFGDGPVAFKGPESRSATKAELTAYQKKVIDESGADFIKQKIGADVKALITSPF